jgi:hypothetical protein
VVAVNSRACSAATTFGIWLSARIDTATAAEACDATAACVRRWR